MRFPAVRRVVQSARRVPSPALVVALLALGGGLTQTAWAQTLLTGADIQNASLTGQDVKDGSIGPSDLSRAGRAALAGKVGPSGPAGPKGEAGAAGPQGERGAVGAQGPVGATGAAGKDAATTWLITDGGTSPDGATITASSGEPITVQWEQGVYKLTFDPDRDVLACAALVSRRPGVFVDGPDHEPTNFAQQDGDAGRGGYALQSQASASTLYVRLLKPDGTGGDYGPFSLVLFC